MERKRILFYGDSNTWGYNGWDGQRYPEDVRFTGRLAQIFADRYAIVEAGLNGRTTAFEDNIGPCRNGYAYLPVTLFTNDPLELVVFMLGTNDCKRRLGACTEEICRGLELLIHEVRSHSLIKEKMTKIAIVSPPPMTAEVLLADPMFDRESLEKSRKLPEAFRKLAEDYGIFYLNAGEYCRPGRADGVHLDEEGHGKLADALAEKLPVWAEKPERFPE